MATLTFDPDNTLAGGLFALTPREVIALGIGLCRAVEDSVGADGVHGAVWPGNISQADGQLALGPAGCGTVAEMSPDALEFLAPEQFWNGVSTAASDVYSIGLILYTALNGGVMPFFAPDAAHSPENRANALQNRMKGNALPFPKSAGRELGAIVLKAVAFQAEERYPKPAALMLALEALPEGADVPSVAPVLPLSEAEVQNAHNYKVDKNFEPIVPDKPKKPRKPRRDAEAVDEDMDAKEFRATPKPLTRWLIPGALVVCIIVAAVLLLRGCNDNKEPGDFPIDTEAPTDDPTATDGLIHPPVATVSPVPVESADPAETPVPEETPAPEETGAPETAKYEIFVENVTWEQAKAACEDKGGHLATVKSAEELAEVIALAEDNGAQFVWLGAYRADNDHWYYVTGDALTYTVWDTGEPSAKDKDGTREDYLLLWYRPAVGTWTYNDMRNDPISVAARTYSGKTAYVCQYD